MSYSWDGRGSATSELDGAGALASSWSYSALGEVWSGASTDLPRYGWDAEEASPATGLVYLRARYLSVSEGVFTSRDLHLGSAANPATLNRRAYALADPVNLYDPLGLASWLSGVASRISSAASSPFARVAEAVSQAFSAATSRFQSAVGAVQAAVGSASSVSCRPSWAVTVAGYASHVSAAVIERCCDTAAYMVKSAPQPSGPSGPLDIVTSASPSDTGHGALDMLGFLPGIGIVADLANAAWYLAEGDYVNAGLSAFSAIPGAGDAVGAGKVAFKGATFVGGLAVIGEKSTVAVGGLASNASKAIASAETPTILSKRGAKAADSAEATRAFKKPIAHLSGKEKSSDIPSWAQGQFPYSDENGRQFAERLMNERYGTGNWRDGVGGEYSKLKKYGDRGFE